MAAPLSYYLDSYPELSHTDLARRMIREGSPFAERTLRRAIAQARQSTVDTIPDVPEPAAITAPTEYNRYYHYDQTADSYLLFLAGEKPFTLRGETLRNLKRSYSDWDGQPATINEICRRFTLSRRLFTKLKNALGWSHDAEPFTDEEILGKSEDELVADLLQTKKFALEQRYQSQELKDNAADARKWRDFLAHQLQPFEQQLTHRLSTPLPSSGYNSYSDYCCVLSPFDLHFGKYGWQDETGSPYNREIARHLLLTHTEELLDDLAGYPLAKFIVPVGSDFFHVDTDKGETTGGTRQDTDGSVVQIYTEGCALMIEFIDRLAAYAPVEIKLAAGNHDRLLSHALLTYLQGYYRQSNSVTVVVSHLPRQYVQWGSSVLGFTHGDGVKPQDLPLLMMMESKAEGVIENRVWFTGHYHHTKLTDLKGTLLIQMPSLSGADRWHARNGYVGSVRGMCAYLLCKQRGLRLTLHSSL